MFNAPYRFCNIGSHPFYDGEREKRYIYKFKSSNRPYLVTLDAYKCGVVAIKYCARSDFGSKNAYNKILNNKGNDAIRIISTCLHIMLAHWSKHRNTSFSFIGALRLIDDISPETIKKRQLFGAKLEQHKKARFVIYKYAMYQLFDPADFEHSIDAKNAIYLLINNCNVDKSIIKREVVELLSHQYDSFFDEV